MQKDYGNLSLTQLRELMQFEAMFDEERKEAIALLRSKPTYWKTISESLIPWAPYYDGPMINQLMGFLYAFGFMGEVRTAAQAEDPQQAVLDMVKRAQSDDQPTPGQFEALLKGYGLLIGLTNSFDSLRIFGSYINDLVEEGRNGNDKAFFDAIRIDPAVVSTKSFEVRMSRAVVENDQKFMSDLRRALNGKTKKHESQLNRVRFAIRALLDLGGLDLPDDELYELFVQKLNLYAPGEDAPKALRKHIRKQKKHSTTQKR